MKISVPIEVDANGYTDRQCPSENCGFLFKVNEEDWINIFCDEEVWCPFCRHKAPADEWFTNEQIEHAKAEALTIVKGKIHNALQADARKFNRKQPKGGLISLSMKVTGGRERTYAIPVKAVEEMQLEIECEECNSRFAVIGSAYFCPACGHNSVSRTFSDSLQKIRVKKDNVDLIRTTLSDSVGKDEAEITCRSMMETCISDGVVAFQKYCEGLYSPYGNIPFNAFQRISQGSELWENALNEGYSDWLSSREITDLNILYQKRHILSHKEGIVDDRYIQNSGDSSYVVGQRIVISKQDIELLLTCLEKLKQGIVTAINNSTE